MGHILLGTAGEEPSARGRPGGTNVNSTILFNLTVCHTTHNKQNGGGIEERRCGYQYNNFRSPGVPGLMSL